MVFWINANLLHHLSLNNKIDDSDQKAYNEKLAFIDGKQENNTCRLQTLEDIYVEDMVAFLNLIFNRINSMSSNGLRQTTCGTLFQATRL